MKTFALLYHDVLDGPDPDASGLPGKGAAIYKLDRSLFQEHVEAIAARVTEPPATLDGAADEAATRWVLTFDDGGRTALHPTADLLEEFGWNGHFFVTAGRVGTPAFLDAASVRELAARGHVVGSHSWSHPPRISALPPADLREEWRRSVGMLEDTLGAPVTTGSVPGGYHSAAVARAAAEAGIRLLFTSEPEARVRHAHGIRLQGRYSIQRHTSPTEAAAFAAGNAVPRARQWLVWNAKKVAKLAAGTTYIRAREKLLRDVRF